MKLSYYDVLGALVLGFVVGFCAIPSPTPMPTKPDTKLVEENRQLTRDNASLKQMINLLIANKVTFREDEPTVQLQIPNK